MNACMHMNQRTLYNFNLTLSSPLGITKQILVLSHGNQKKLNKESFLTKKKKNEEQWLTTVLSDKLHSWKQVKRRTCACALTVIQSDSPQNIVTL